MSACCVCQAGQCHRLLDFGRQPVCHHFRDETQHEGLYPLVLGRCERCGLVQLMEKVPAPELVPRFDWLVNNEPEDHLDALVDVLCTLPGVSPDANICGVSHKDESLLCRFRKKGFEYVWAIDRKGELEIENPRAGIETIQQRMKPLLAATLQQRHGVPDVVIARHVLEHADEPVCLMETLRCLSRPRGYVVFEVPDCALPFQLFDYTVLWEEHRIYFTECTLRTCLEAGGFFVEQILSYPAPYETVLVAITRPQATRRESFACPTKEGERAISFANGFSQRQRDIRGLLLRWKKTGKIALFGAGHHAVMFTNLMGVGDLIEFVLDDHPCKRGLRMPGTRLPIVGSEKLMEENIVLCLSSLGAGSERKVLSKIQRFIDRGGAFASIFPTDKKEPLTFRAGPHQPEELRETV